MVSRKEVVEDLKWLFEKLLTQRPEGNWVHKELGRYANLLLKISPEIDEFYKYYDELTDFNDKFLKEEIRNKLISQKRRHEYRENFDITHWLRAVEHFDCRCAYCGADDKLTIDHYVAFSKGGELKSGNIVPACPRCNSSKNNHSFEDWYAGQKFYSADKEKMILDFVY